VLKLDLNTSSKSTKRIKQLNNKTKTTKTQTNQIETIQNNKNGFDFEHRRRRLSVLRPRDDVLPGFSNFGNQIRSHLRPVQEVAD
jgi:hypothetical protein